MQDKESENIEKLLSFGTKIQIYRLGMGLSQVELARRCGFSYSYIRIIESGKTNISFVRLLKLSKALNVKPAELVDGLEET
jgi:transcriptional regulator with XRE-family HTH domain